MVTVQEKDDKDMAARLGDVDVMAEGESALARKKRERVRDTGSAVDSHAEKPIA